MSHFEEDPKPLQRRDTSSSDTVIVYVQSTDKLYADDEENVTKQAKTQKPLAIKSSPQTSRTLMATASMSKSQERLLIQNTTMNLGHTSEMALSARETVPIHWPMTIPEYANFAICSSQPVRLCAPGSMQVHATSPIHICCNRRLYVIPAGVPTPGFARGWLKLPVELKLAILRCNLIFSVSIWPSNANAVIRNHLLPYLRMTPDIAEIAKLVFYQENRFIIQFSPSMPGCNTAVVKPPMPVRSQLRHIKFLTRLTVLDWKILREISGEGDRVGFRNIVHLEVRCLLKEAAMDYMSNGRFKQKNDVEASEEDHHYLQGPPIRFPFDGVVLYDMFGCDSTGNWEEDITTLTWLQTMKDLVSTHITFNHE
ncbi:hypothetical protein P3342_003787 [Pyrenophora teres f. teres]|nr:hypothetical protein P3342_003787 [Pyrenophora teres f. teres]